MAGYAAGSLASALARGGAAGLAWLAIAYLAVGYATPGSLDMIKLTASIAGLPAAAAYGITFLVSAGLSLAASAFVYFLMGGGGAAGSGAKA